MHLVRPEVEQGERAAVALGFELGGIRKNATEASRARINELGDEKVSRVDLGSFIGHWLAPQARNPVLCGIGSGWKRSPARTRARKKEAPRCQAGPECQRESGTGPGCQPKTERGEGALRGPGLAVRAGLVCWAERKAAAGDGCGWEPRPRPGSREAFSPPFFFFSFYLLLQIFSKENFEHKQ